MFYGMPQFRQKGQLTDPLLVRFGHVHGITARNILREMHRRFRVPHECVRVIPVRRMRSDPETRFDLDRGPGDRNRRFEQLQ